MSCAAGDGSVRTPWQQPEGIHQYRVHLRQLGQPIERLEAVCSVADHGGVYLSPPGIDYVVFMLTVCRRLHIPELGAGDYWGPELHFRLMFDKKNPLWACEYAVNNTPDAFKVKARQVVGKVRVFQRKTSTSEPRTVGKRRLRQDTPMAGEAHVFPVTQPSD